MKHPVTRFKSLKVCLKELEPFIRNGQHLRTGKPFQRFGGLRSRELLANWLLCVVLNSMTQDERLTFVSDPYGGDGIIWDSITERGWPSEHVMVPRSRSAEMQDVETLILNAIQNKNNKGGAAYASGKTLLVFTDVAGGPWYPNKVARQLPQPLHFDAVWVVGLREVESNQYVYGVTLMDLTDGNAPTWLVRVAKDFDAWEVRAIQ